MLKGKEGVLPNYEPEFISRIFLLEFTKDDIGIGVS